MSSSLGGRIRSLRKQIGYTQEEFADLCGVNRVTVGIWENDRKVPGGKNLEKIARALNVSVDTLMTPPPEQKNAPVSQEANEGDNINVQFNSDNSNNKGTINQSVTTRAGSSGLIPQELASTGSVYVRIKKYNYSDVVKLGLPGAVDVGLMIMDKDSFSEFDDENPPFAIVQNESFNLGRFGLQNVKTAIFTSAGEIDEEGKFYLISYNGRTSLQRVRKIPPASGFIIENDDGDFNISSEFAKSGSFTVIGKLAYRIAKE